ncbi:MAG: phosphonate ABC transporter, permease protein PhnE [Pontimonas sp.]
MSRPALPTKPVDWVRRIGTAVVVVLVLWSLLGLDIKWERLIDLPADLWRVAVLMFGEMPFDETGKLIAALWESVSIAWLGTIIAAVFAIPLSFLAAENLVGRPVAWSMRQVFNVLRAVPEVILAIALIPIFGLTPMAGVLAIGIGSIGTLGKLFYEIAEGIHPGPIEALDATGANRLQRLRWGVLPQLLPEYASFVLYRFEVNIRASAVMGLIGAGGIGNDVAQALRFKEFGTAGLGLLIIIVGTIAIDYLSGRVRRRIINGPGETGHSPTRVAPPVTP